MDAETYPDVTLANYSGTEQHGLNSQNQNNDSGKDTFVVLRPKRRISTARTVLVTLVALIVIAVAVLITFFITKHICSQSVTEYSGCGQSFSAQFENGTTESITEISTFPNLNVSSLYPWSGIRLPRSVKPSFYELHLQIDLTTFTYHGAVNITIEVITPTKYIVFHRNKIDIDISSVSITSRYSRNINILQQFQVPERDFHVLEVDKELETGNMYILSVGIYTGKLGRDLKGLYLSSYSNQEGEVR